MQTDERLTNPDAPEWGTPEGRAVLFCLNPRPRDPLHCLRCGQGTTSSGVGKKRENAEGLPFCSQNCRIIFYEDLEFARSKGCTSETAANILTRLLS
jgi:hypothetical protein